MDSFLRGPKPKLDLVCGLSNSTADIFSVMNSKKMSVVIFFFKILIGFNGYSKRKSCISFIENAALTDNMGETAANTAAMLCGKLAFMEGAEFSPDVSRVLDSKQVSDHHAIIPTMELSSAAMQESILLPCLKAPRRRHG